MRMWMWLLGGLGVCGCAAPAADDGDESSSAGESTSTRGAESDTTTVTDPMSGGETTTETETDPGAGEATTDYPTHMTCDDDGSGYDIPSLDDTGGESSGGGEDTTDGMGDDIPIGATVFAVRQRYVPAGTWVEVGDLVVTSPVAPLPMGDAMVFAQHPDGGEHSAIPLIFALPEQASALAMGDRVRVRGYVGERYIFTAIAVDIGGEALVLEGTSPLPVAQVLTAGDLIAGAAAAEAYESAIVRIENPAVEMADSCIGEFTIDAGIGVDDLFLGDAAPDPAAGDTFSAVNGPLRYTFNGFEIVPRTADDVEP